MTIKQLLGFSLSLFTATTALTIPSLPSQAQSISCAVSNFGPSGGVGGGASSFQLPNTSRIQSIVIRSATTVLSGIRINTVSNTGQASAFTVGGTTGGQVRTINFGTNERITGISGRFGTFVGGADYVTNITIRTNLRSYGPFGATDLPPDYGVAYSYPVPASYNFAGLDFRSGLLIDAIGLKVRRSNCNA